MDGATLSKYPHYSWFGAWSDVEADCALVSIHMRQVAHCLIYTSHERADVRWIHQGREETFWVDAGTTRISPADGEQHTLLGRCRLGHRFFTLLIPEGHVRVLAEGEGVTTDGTLRYSLQRRDPVLCACLNRLGCLGDTNGGPYGERHDEAARRLVLRLVELSGGLTPDWQDDEGVFGPRTLGHLVEHIDAHLTVAPTLAEMSLQTGLSPSHFAKKFRNSMGLSLYRFINRRRVRASLESLRDVSLPLSFIAKQLGFSSHSHFTRVFHHLTGMTPVKYRKDFKRTVG